MIVEGTVARADSVVRISARLVNVGTERPLWAESYERTLSNVLILQSDVARAIVENVRVRVTPGETERLGSARTVDARAHEEYLRGLAEYNEYAGQSHRSALQHFRNAIEIDPSYASAHAAMAATYAYLSGMWLDPAEAIPRARASALKAIEIDPNLASAHAVLAYVKAAGDWDWTGAEAGFRRALAINSNEVLTHQNYGALLVVLGRFDEAREEFARARKIDPLSPLTATMSLWPLFEGRRYHDAIREARTLVLLDSTANSPRMVLGQALTMIGDHDAAIAELRKAIELDPSNPFPLGWLALAYGAAGRRDDALGVLRGLQADERDGKYIQPYTYAIVHIGLGEKTKALEWLEIGFQRRSDEMAFLKVDPGLDLLRGEPRFRALLAKMAFPS
jgi:Tfp pilus assembly protein PilF